MRIVVTGAAGQVGSDLVDLVGRRSDCQVTGATRGDLDLEVAHDIGPFVDALRPDAVVNCAAYNAVDRAEDEPEAAHAVNATAVAELASACARRGAFFLQVSTDYVFDGQKGGPYDETDEPAPRSAYGRSKLAGEQAVVSSGVDHAIVRTAWVFGRVGRSLVEAIVDRIVTGRELRMVDDQTGSPTYARDLAGTLLQVVTERVGGLFHVTNRGMCTPHRLALDVAELLGRPDASIEAVTTEELGRPAPRPAFSALTSVRLAAAGLEPLRHYRDALGEVVPEMAAAVEKAG